MNRAEYGREGVSILDTCGCDLAFAWQAERIHRDVSSAPTGQSKASSSCPKGGSSKERWARSTARDACQRTSRPQSNLRSHGCSSPSLFSSREGSPGNLAMPVEFRVRRLD